MLLARQDEYKSAAMQAKTAGDLRTATKYLAVSKVTTCIHGDVLVITVV